MTENSRRPRYIVLDTKNAESNSLGRILTRENMFDSTQEAFIEAEIRNRQASLNQIGDNLNEMQQLSRILIAVLRNVDGRTIIFSFDDLEMDLAAGEELYVHEDHETQTGMIAIKSKDNSDVAN